MIRAAELKDLRRIVEMSERFYPYTSYATKSNIPFNPGAAAVLAQGLLEDSVLVVYELGGVVMGMLGVIIIPFLFNPEYLTAGEVIWWVEPEVQSAGLGEELLLAIEPKLREKGITHVQMIDLVNSPVTAANLYQKHGYELTERCYTKVL